MVTIKKHNQLTGMMPGNCFRECSICKFYKGALQAYSQVVVNTLSHDMTGKMFGNLGNRTILRHYIVSY